MFTKRRNLTDTHTKANDESTRRNKQSNKQPTTNRTEYNDIYNDILLAQASADKP